MLFILYNKCKFRVWLFYPTEQHRLPFPWCTPELLSASVPAFRREWALHCGFWPHRVAPYFLWGLGPNGQTEITEEATSSQPSWLHVVSTPRVHHPAFISLGFALSVLNTFKFAYFSNPFSLRWAMRLIILWFPSFFLRFNFIYFWLRWVFVAARGLSLVAVSGGYSSLRCTGFSLRWLLLLRSTGSRAQAQ